MVIGFISYIYLTLYVKRYDLLCFLTFFTGNTYLCKRKEQIQPSSYLILYVLTYTLTQECKINEICNNFLQYKFEIFQMSFIYFRLTFQIFHLLSNTFQSIVILLFLLPPVCYT